MTSFFEQEKWCKDRGYKVKAEWRMLTDQDGNDVRFTFEKQEQAVEFKLVWG